MTITIDLSKLQPVFSLLVGAYKSVRLRYVDWQLRNCDMAAPFYGQLLRKRTKLAQGRLF